MALLQSSTSLLGFLVQKVGSNRQMRSRRSIQINHASLIALNELIDLKVPKRKQGLGVEINLFFQLPT